jgi:hypothetical protein
MHLYRFLYILYIKHYLKYNKPNLIIYYLLKIFDLILFN